MARANALQPINWTNEHIRGRHMAKTLGQLQTAATTVFSGRLRRKSNKKFPESSKSYTIRKIFHHRIQISCSFHLIHHVSHGSSKNTYDIKTSNSSYKLISQPNSNIILSACSAKLDLHIYGKRIAKGENRFQPTWNCSSLFTRVQSLYSSKSTPLNLY